MDPPFGAARHGVRLFRYALSKSLQHVFSTPKKTVPHGFGKPTHNSAPSATIGLAAPFADHHCGIFYTLFLPKNVPDFQYLSKIG
jgi:hypothetical protein